jgi:polyphosphate glucokinase
MAPEVRASTPHPCPPEVLISALANLVAPLPSFERVSVGFPGVVRDRRVLTAPHLGDERWSDYPLAAGLERLWHKPVRVANDAEVHGLGIVTGHGLEMVVTLGTGVGTALFRDGQPTPHLELAHHPLRGGRTYDEYLGLEALRRVGFGRWNARLRWAIDVLYGLVRYDTLYLGGGHSAKVVGDLPANVRLASNVAGLIGGIRLWSTGAASGSARCCRQKIGSNERKHSSAAVSPASIAVADVDRRAGCHAARTKS